MKLSYFETFIETKHGKIKPQKKRGCFGKKRKKRKNEDKKLNAFKEKIKTKIVVKKALLLVIKKRKIRANY